MAIPDQDNGKTKGESWTPEEIASIKQLLRYALIIFGTVAITLVIVAIIAGVLANIFG